MDKYTTYVGMDVHARSVTAMAFCKETGEVSKKRFGDGYAASDLVSWFDSFDGPLYCAYESGCTGIRLARELRAMGYACDVIAISTLARSTKDKQQKCDKLDARAILREITNLHPSYSVVWIPTEKQEGLRDMCRLYKQMLADAKRAKQELGAFLLRHGCIWNERTRSKRLKKASGKDYERWLNSIDLKDAYVSAAFREYRARADLSSQNLLSMKRKLLELADADENKPFIQALKCIKGIDTITAMCALAEIGDFTRFASGRKISCWLGCVPKNDSSAEDEVHGPITKAGNKYLRHALVEAMSSIVWWKGPHKAIPKGYEPSADIVHIAHAANDRLYRRYDHLAHERLKHTNKAKVAVVNELIRWIWVMGCQVQRNIDKAG